MRGLVITPTYNESANVVQIIGAVLKSPADLDMLIVDDNSPDGTADLVIQNYGDNERVHLIRRAGPRGFGPSYVDGFRYALEKGYDAVFTMDADFSHDPEKLPEMKKALETYDVSVGSRYCGGRVSVVNWPLFRLFLSVFAGKYVRTITGLKAADPTSGFRGMRSDVLRAIGLDTLKSNGYSFLVETLYRIKVCGFSIVEVPIVFTERREGQSKMSKKIMLEATLMPWRIRFSRFRPDRTT